MSQKKLTNKQQAFINEYLTCWNATEAAKKAGYSDKTAYSIGSENLRKPKISEAIQQRVQEMSMSADEALIRLSEHARGDIGKFLDYAFDDLHTHPQSHLIKRVKRTVSVRRNRKSDEETETEHFEFELYDAQSAIALVLKEQHLKAGEATEIVDDASLTDEKRVDRITELLNAGRTRRDGRAADGGEYIQ